MILASVGKKANASTSSTKVLAFLALGLLIAQLPLATVIAPVSAAAPVTVYVSPSGHDNSGDGSAGNPYQTISHAVSVVSSGSTVLVQPGTYAEMVNITTKVSLLSVSGNPADTVIDATGLSMGVMVMGAATAGTIVEGFTVANANNHGIYAQDTSKIIIEHNFVTNNGLNPTPAFSGEDKAINLVGTSYSVIADNQVINNKYGGIAINDNGPVNPGYYSPGTLNAAVGNIVSGNTVVGNKPHHCSIVVSAYDAGAGVIDNIVSSNIVLDNSAGIVIAANTPNSASINNSVIYNEILNNGEAGVVLHANAPGAENAGTLVMGNTFSGNGIPVDVKEGSSGPIMIARFTGVLIGGESTSVSPHDTWVIGNVFQNQFNAIFQVNGTDTTAYSNTFDATVTNKVNATGVSGDPVQAQFSQLTGTINSLQSSMSALDQSAAKSTDLSALSNTVSSLSSALSSLQSSAAKQSDLSALSGNVATVSSNVDSISNTANTSSYIAYAALALAIVLLGLDVVLFRRRPAAP